MDILGFFISFILTGIVFSFIVLRYIVACIGRMRMFQKAGTEGWKAWIPFYRDYVLCEITMGRGWYFLLSFVPFLYPVMRVLYAVEICLSYGQEMIFGVAYFFVPTICELILGFGKAQYLGSQDLDGQIRHLFGAEKKAKRPNPETVDAEYKEYTEEETAGKNDGKAAGDASANAGSGSAETKSNGGSGQTPPEA